MEKRGGRSWAGTGSWLLELALAAAVALGMAAVAGEVQALQAGGTSPGTATAGAAPG